MRRVTKPELKRELSYAVQALRAWTSRHHTVLASVALAGFVLGVLLFAIVGQPKVADTAPPAGPALAPVAPTVHGPRPRPNRPAPQPPVQPGQQAQPATRWHAVTAGETLAGIAVRYQIPVEQIAADNRIANPNRIQIGQRLALGVPAPGLQVIQPGATLSDYAQRHGLNVADLIALNPHITDPDRIMAGAGLRVART